MENTELKDMKFIFKEVVHRKDWGICIRNMLGAAVSLRFNLKD